LSQHSSVIISFYNGLARWSPIDKYMTSYSISNYTLYSFESIANKRRIGRENIISSCHTHEIGLQAYDENGGGNGSHLKGTNGTFSEFWSSCERTL